MKVMVMSGCPVHFCVDKVCSGSVPSTWHRHNVLRIENAALVVDVSSTLSSIRCNIVAVLVFGFSVLEVLRTLQVLGRSLLWECLLPTVLVAEQLSKPQDYCVTWTHFSNTVVSVGRRYSL